MPRPKKSTTAVEAEAEATLLTDLDPSEPAGEDAEGLVQEGQLVCRLTNLHFTATLAEEKLQDFIEQLHREYRVEFVDMERDFRIACEFLDPKSNRTKSRNRNISLAVFESGKPHTVENVIRVAIIKPGVKADESAIAMLDEVLANLSDDRDPVFGVWTSRSKLPSSWRSPTSAVTGGGERLATSEARTESRSHR